MAVPTLVLAFLISLVVLSPASGQPKIAGVASVIGGDSGQRASFALADHIGRSTIRCQPRHQDRCGRMIAVCFKGNEDMNPCMVANRWAVACQRYALNHVNDEEATQESGINIWPGYFEICNQCR